MSLVTMWKAVRRHERSAGGARESAAKSSAPPAVPDSRQHAWHRVKEQMARDLLQDRLPHQTPLPQIKELCTRYHAGFRPVRRALSALCREGVLSREGVRYHAAFNAPAGSSIRIGVLVFAWYQGPLILFAEYDQEFVRSLELEGNRAHVGMELMGYRFEDGGAVFYDAQQKFERTLSARDGMAGYVVPVCIPATLGGDLFARLHATGKPVVMIDEIGGWELPEYVAASGRFLVIDARPYHAAACGIARACIALGHRRCAFFSTFHSDRWSQQCLSGLSEIFAQAGPEYAVVPFVQEGTQLTDDLLHRARARVPDALLRQSYDRHKAGMPQAYVRQLEPFFSLLLEQQIAYAEVRLMLEPFFARAYSDKSITCWIAADVDTAWFTSDYIKARPRKLSMVTFGCSPEITRSRIAAYDFNTAGAALAVLGFVLYPHRRLPGQEGMRVVIQGSLICRESLRGVRNG